MTISMSSHAQIRHRQRGHQKRDTDLILEFGTYTNDGVLMRDKDVRMAADQVLADAKHKIEALQRLKNIFMPLDGSTIITIQRARNWKQKRLLRDK